MATFSPDREAGDATRDPHVHIEFRVLGQCQLGHRWGGEMHMTLHRLPNA